ncbi:Crustacean cardioactive peptide receptor [Carabus blaptoides fortunei]
MSDSPLDDVDASGSGINIFNTTSEFRFRLGSAQDELYRTTASQDTALELDTNISRHLVLVNGSPTVTDEINSFFFYKTEQFTILWILFVTIVIGNSAVLLTLTFNKSRKSRMNFFIKQLAIADLTVGLISVLTDIIWRMTVTWHAGNVACKLIRFLQATVTYSSTYVLVALSIDRYDAITHPMNFTGSWRRARALVISAWIISIIFSIPEIFLFEEKPIEGQLQCWIELQPWQWRVYMTLITVALLIAPAIIISACYTVIVRTIWSKSKLLVPMAVTHHPQQHQHQHQASRRSRCAQRAMRQYEENDTRRASSRGIIPKAKIKTVKMTFVIVFDYHGGGDTHTESRPTQLSCQSSHLLPILNTHMSYSQAIHHRHDAHNPGAGE